MQYNISLVSRLCGFRYHLLLECHSVASTSLKLNTQTQHTRMHTHTEKNPNPQKPDVYFGQLQLMTCGWVTSESVKSYQLMTGVFFSLPRLAGSGQFSGKATIHKPPYPQLPYHHHCTLKTLVSST